MVRERGLGAKSAKGLVCGGVVDWGGELNRQGKENRIVHSDIGAAYLGGATAYSDGFDSVWCDL